MLAVEKPEKTTVCLLVDKEEIGSVGATGMHSRFFENTVAEIMNLAGCYSELVVRRCLARSRMLSSDVSAAYDPNFASVNEKKNTAYFGRGIVFNKYTGARGKSGSNDCSAEYMALVRRIMDDAGVYWQTSELGKVDQGGGGTIAYITANYGMEVIDCGIAVLNMHAPWEIGSKADIYEAKKGYIAFLQIAYMLAGRFCDGFSGGRYYPNEEKASLWQQRMGGFASRNGFSSEMPGMLASDYGTAQAR